MTRHLRVLTGAGLALVVGVVGCGAWLGWSLLRPGPPEELQIEVPEGAATVEVLELLAARGLLPSTTAGRLYLVVAGRGRPFRFGSYRVAGGSRPVDVLELVMAGRVDTVEVRIVEGSDAAAVAEAMAAAGYGDEAGWLEIVADPRWVRALAPDAPSLEGFLFPDTYRFAVGLAPGRAAHHMVDRFLEVWREERARTGTPWGSPLEVVTLASLVEAETSHADERARIAGVFVNRLRLGMLLQCDPTVIYALKRQGLWQGRLLRVHLELDDPYNTYRYPGLPPSPINNPGRAALAAALDPADHDELYFVANPDGGHSFSTNLRDHNRAVQRLRHARR